MLYSKKESDALHQSVMKWAAVVLNERADGGLDDCECCRIWFKEATLDCGDCPINIDSDHGGCSDTPYGLWMVHQVECHMCEEAFRIHCETCEKLATDMFLYLQRLHRKSVLLRDLSAEGENNGE